MLLIIINPKIYKKMKAIRILLVAAVSSAMLLGGTACNMNNTGKGALIGGGSGAAVGAGVGALIGKGKGAGIGAAVGTAVGAGVGALIGNHMDKQKKQLEEQLAQQAKVEETTDANGLKAIRVTFDGGILFPTNGTTLSQSARTDLSKFAANLKENVNTDVAVYGFTDNTGSMAANTKVANGRADAVETFLVNQGVAKSRITAEGRPMTDYVASNATAEGRAENRRVEIYIYANEEMIKQAEAGTLK